MKKYKYLLTLPFLVFLFFLPSQTSAWNNSNYIYRSTVLGSGINDTGNYIYKIINQKNNFSTNESVYVLTRIFNITHLDRFQFKFQLLTKQGEIKSELYSPLYQPNGNWWAETYAWHNFGKLDANNYEIKIYLSINNGVYRYLDRQLITVQDNYYSNNYNNAYYNNYFDNNSVCYHSSYNRPYYSSAYYHEPSYEHNWTYTGTDVEKYGKAKYKVLNRQTDFDRNDEVHVLTKLSGISNIRQFKIKHELYLNNNSQHLLSESDIFWPNDDNWDYNYTWHNFGKLPDGEYVIRAYIKIGNENYKLISSVNIKVGQEANNYQYKYSWTKSDTRINYLGNYKYEAYNNRTVFYTDEAFKVLTKLSNIVGVDIFQVRHELRYSGNALYRRLNSEVQRPNYRRWDYNFVENDFGKVLVGEYKLITYIKINNGSFQEVNRKNITVQNRIIDIGVNNRCYSGCGINYTNNYAQNNKPSYNYSWTRIGTQSYPQSRRTAYNYY